MERETVFRKLAGVAIVMLLTALALFVVLQYYPIFPQPQRIVEINLVARQWYYDAEILNKTDSVAQAVTVKTLNSFANTTIVLTKDDLVIIHFRTEDVPHGFAINGYPEVGPYEATPGQTITFQFTADKAGTFIFYCTVFCGPGHPEHRGTLIVLP